MTPTVSRSTRRTSRLAACLSVALCVVAHPPATGAQSNLPPEVIAYADIVAYNGIVLTADDRFTIAEALAVRDGKFLAVGKSQEILAMAGPKTRKIDLRGRSVTPGFIDSHQHLPLYATQSIFMERPGIQWEGKFNPGGPWLHWESPEHILRNVKRAADVTPPGEWVVVYGESETRHVAWDLKRSQLDAVAPNHPVAVAMAAGDINAVNSMALARLPQGMPGRPKGDDARIDQPAAEILLLDLLWSIPIERTMEALKKRMKDYNATSGLTTIGTRIYPTELTALRELWIRGELTIRWRVGIDWATLGPDPELTLRQMGNISDLGDDWFRISGMAGGAGDSSAQSGGAWTWKPKLRIDIPGMDVKFGPHGPRDLNDKWRGQDLVTLMVRYGWSIANSHSVGDKSTSAYLDAYEEARKQGLIVKSSNQRLTIDHLTMVRPQDIPRFKELGVIPSISPWFLYMSPNPELLEHQYGADRVNQMMPAKSYLDAGVRPTIEADVDFRPYRDPLWSIARFVTRKDEKGRIWNPTEAVTRQQALLMHTNWKSYQRGEEKKLGTIEAGKLADFVVLGGDYLTVPDDKLADLPIVMTVVGGKIVHDSGR